MVGVHRAELKFFQLNFFILVSFTGFLPKAKPPINVVGDVGGKIAIIVVRFDSVFYCTMVGFNV